MELYSVKSGEGKVSSEHQPLAARMRPANLEEMVGQKQLLSSGSPLRRLIETNNNDNTLPSSIILWGPAGSGKTTIANIISENANRQFLQLSAVTSGVKDVREALEKARKTLMFEERETVLFIDEVHRFSKSQQDALLPGVENGEVILVAATTENPSFSVITPLLSRSLLLRLEPLSDENIYDLLDRAIQSPKGLNNKVKIGVKTKKHLAQLAQGDVRKALNVLEAAAGAALTGKTKKKPEITLDILEKSLDIATIRYDRQGDEHYDVASAFIKSMRGSDADATLHYLAKMIVAGEDSRFIARRIMIAAAEEVGLADQQVLQTTVAAAQAVQMVGFPEAELILAEAAVAVAVAPKSNAITVAIGSAVQDVKMGLGSRVPEHLRDAHYANAKKLGHGKDYKYAHDAPYAVAKQQYLPDDLTEMNRQYYIPNSRGNEAKLSETVQKLRKMLGKNK